MIMHEVECLLWHSLNRGSVRMTPRCENPYVKSGSQICDHFIGKSRAPSEFATDITNTCRRASASRTIPSPTGITVDKSI